jgi:hypothetical protein
MDRRWGSCWLASMIAGLFHIGKQGDTERVGHRSRHV